MALDAQPQPRQQLPDLWAEKMSCPYCGSRPLGVFHPTGQADRFICQSCETSFQLEDKGTRIRFVTLPALVTPAMRGQWVPLEDALAAFASQQNDTLISHAKEDAPTAGPAPAPRESEQPGAATEPESPEHSSADAESVLEDVADVSDKPNETSPNPSDQNGTRTPSFMDNIQPPPASLDNPDKKTGGTSPFYENDIDAQGIFPEPKVTGDTQTGDDLWKVREDLRVRNSLPTSPPSVPAFGKPGVSGMPEYVHSDTGEEDFVPPSDMEEQFTSSAGRTTMGMDEEVPDLENPPPVNPLEDTPPSAISYVHSHATSMPVEEDLSDLRSQVVGADSGIGLTERKESAAERALELQRLGNTENEVRSILERSSGLTPEQVQEVLQGLDKPEERKRSSRLLIIFSVIAIVIFTLIAWWFLSSWQAQPQIEEPSPDGVSTESLSSFPGEIINVSSLPAPLQTLVPNGLRIFNDPIEVVPATVNMLPPTTCPRSKTEAAALFGGPAENWDLGDQNRGWVLVTQQQSVEIKVPTGMSAGYLMFERGPEMKSVLGPAIVRNIFMITISCE